MTRRYPAAAGGALVLIIAAIMARDYPFVGHDFRYFIPRLIDTDLFMRINGPVVQWYTPSFGGGLPAFSNPQHLQYSIVQALTLIVNPWIAIVLTTILVSLAGFAAMFRLCRTTLGLDAGAATLGALFFVGNGFYIEHLIVGHLGFQLFPLAAVMLAALLERDRLIVSAATLAVMIGLMLHQAGFYLLIVCALGIALSLPLLFLYRRDLIVPGRVLKIGIAGATLGIVIASPRIVASLYLMQQFPRQIADHYGIGIAQGIAGFVAQLTGVMTLTPLFAVTGTDLSRISNALMKLTGASVRSGLWEVDTALSPVLIAFLFIGAAGAITWWRAGRRERAEWIALTCLAIGSWIVIESTLARGLIYPLIKGLPVISSLHVNHRLAGAFVLPLSLAGAMAANSWLMRRSASWYFAILAVTLAAPLSYLAIPSRSFLRTFDVTHALETYAAVRNGDRFPIDRIAAVEDADTFQAHASSVQTYEPLFGYAGESFAPLTHVGPVRDVTGVFFNMTDPTVMAFPDPSVMRSSFRPITESDRASLEAFVSRRQPDWPVPTFLRVLNFAGASMFVVCAGLSLMRFRRKDAGDVR